MYLIFLQFEWVIAQVEHSQGPFHNAIRVNICIFLGHILY